jgi:hypothetical protein
MEDWIKSDNGILLYKLPVQPSRYCTGRSLLKELSDLNLTLDQYIDKFIPNYLISRLGSKIKQYYYDLKSPVISIPKEFNGMAIGSGRRKYYWIPSEYTENPRYVSVTHLSQELNELGHTLEEYYSKFIKNTDLESKFSIRIAASRSSNKFEIPDSFKGFVIGEGANTYYWIPGEINTIEPGHGYYIKATYIRSELEQYNLTEEDYYLRYLSTTHSIPKCINCGNPTFFIRLSRGFSTVCSDECKVEYSLRSIGFKSGKFISKKCSEPIIYKSSYELAALNKFEVTEDIVEIQYEKLQIKYYRNNKLCIYYPDFIIRKSTGEIQIIEVKPEKLLSLPLVKLKLEALKNYCELNGIRYFIWTENDLGLTP